MLISDKEKANKILKNLLGNDDLVERWWNSPNRAFDEELPDDLWNTSIGRNKIYTYLLNQLECSY
jgi:uncharacterized protein (DUF2384 family)